MAVNPCDVVFEAFGRCTILVLASKRVKARLEPTPGSLVDGLDLPGTGDPCVCLLHPLESKLNVKFVSLADLQRSPLSNGPLLMECQQAAKAGVCTEESGGRENPSAIFSASIPGFVPSEQMDELAQHHLAPVSDAVGAGRSFGQAVSGLQDSLRATLQASTATGSAKLSPWCARYFTQFFRRLGASDRECLSHPVAYVTLTAWDEEGPPEAVAASLFDARAPPQVFFDHAIDPSIPAVHIVLGPDRQPHGDAPIEGSAGVVDEARADAALGSLSSAFGVDACLMVRPQGSWTARPLSNLFSRDTEAALRQFLRASLLDKRALPRLRTIGAALSDYVAARRSKVSKLTAWVLGAARGKSSRQREAAAAQGVPGLFAITFRSPDGRRSSSGGKPAATAGSASSTTPSASPSSSSSTSSSSPLALLKNASSGRSGGSGGGASNSGQPPPLEMVTRRLADVLLVCGDYAGALAQYKAAAADFKTERQLDASAAAAEMIDVTSFLVNRRELGALSAVPGQQQQSAVLPPPLSTESLVAAFGQYVRLGLHRNATRTALSLHLVRRAAGDYAGAAQACAVAADRINSASLSALTPLPTILSLSSSPSPSSSSSSSPPSSEPPPSPSSGSSSLATAGLEALLNEQAGVCFVAAGQPRKGALRLAFAASAYASACLSVHAQRCFLAAHSAYAGRGWRHIDTRLAVGAATQAARLGQLRAAVATLAAVLSRPSSASLDPGALSSTSALRRAARQDFLHFQLFSAVFHKALAASPSTARTVGSCESHADTEQTSDGDRRLSSEGTPVLPIEGGGDNGTDDMLLLPLPLIQNESLVICRPDDDDVEQESEHSHDVPPRANDRSADRDRHVSHPQVDPLDPVFAKERSALATYWASQPALSVEHKASGLNVLNPAPPLPPLRPPSDASMSSTNARSSSHAHLSSGSQESIGVSAASVGEPLAVLVRVTNPLTVALRLDKVSVWASFQGATGVHAEIVPGAVASETGDAPLECPHQTIDLAPRSWLKVQLLIQPKAQGTVTIHGFRYGLSVGGLPGELEAGGEGAVLPATVYGFWRLPTQARVSVGPPMPLLRAVLVVDGGASSHRGTPTKTVAGGEIVNAHISVRNTGLRPLRQLWLSTNFPLLVRDSHTGQTGTGRGGVLQTGALRLPDPSGELAAGQSFTWPVSFQAPEDSHGRVLFRALFFYSNMRATDSHTVDVHVEENGGSDGAGQDRANSLPSFRLCAAECSLEVGPAPAFDVMPLSLCELPPGADGQEQKDRRLLVVRIRNPWRRTTLRLTRVACTQSPGWALAANETCRTPADGDYGLAVQPDSSRTFTLAALQTGSGDVEGDWVDDRQPSQQPDVSVGASCDRSNVAVVSKTAIADAWQAFACHFHRYALSAADSVAVASGVLKAHKDPSVLSLGFLWVIENRSSSHNENGGGGGTTGDVLETIRIGMISMHNVYNRMKHVGFDLRFRRPRTNARRRHTTGVIHSGTLGRGSVLSAALPRETIDALGLSSGPGLTDDLVDEDGHAANGAAVPLEISVVAAAERGHSFVQGTPCVVSVHVLLRNRSVEPCEARLQCVLPFESFGSSSAVNWSWIGTSDVVVVLEPGQKRTIGLQASFPRAGVYNLNRFRIWADQNELGWPKYYSRFITINDQ